MTPINARETVTAEMRIWLADLTYTQQTIAADVIPNAIGGIATYTEDALSLESPIRVFKYPEKLAEALAECGAPAIIGFSNYVWNADLSHAFARVIKKRSPRTAVVFGGPNYPTDAAEQAAWLEEHPAVDFYLIKEGEVAFANLAGSLLSNGCSIEAVKQLELPSIHARSADGQVRLPKAIERIADLSEIRSPYTSGLLDEFFDGRLLPIIQTNRGCPFLCTFCIEGDRYYNKVRRNGRDKVDAELDYIGQKMQALRAVGGRNDLFIADSNFGMYREDLDTARGLARTRQLYDWPEYINVATGKNQKERVLEASRIIDGALRLSGSVQSLDPGVLENIKRKNIDAQGLFDLGLQAESVGANTYSEIILALPGDSLRAHMSTIRTVMNAGFTNIYLFQLMLLPGTELATPQSKQLYGMTTRYRVLPRCYGYFDVLGERVISAEIEEVCVANATLSYDDYLAARRFHLIVTIYHNDGVFGSLLKLLRSLDVPVYEWMEALSTSPMPASLQELFGAFLTATHEELWDSREALEAFVASPGVVEKFIAGELGNNLLFVHKTLGITAHMDALAAFARTTIQACLDAHGTSTPEVMAFVDDALAYHCARAKNLFHDLDTSPTATLRFDVAGFIAADRTARVDDFELSTPTNFIFVLDDAQRALIRRYLGIYGSSTVSIGRILSKVHVKKLFRQAVSVEESATAGTLPKGDAAFHLSGLQE
jgi:radical SAM superfamily enzyme YgiQ (UPF0313 family)